MTPAVLVPLLWVVSIFGRAGSVVTRVRPYTGQHDRRVGAMERRLRAEFYNRAWSGVDRRGFVVDRRA